MLAEHTFQHSESFPLESGESLPGFQLFYTTFGTLNVRRDNVIWVCHALTGNANLLDWWSGLFGEDKLYNPADYFVICANMLGSCYGSTGPLSVNPQTNQPFFHSFPAITNRDVVQAFDLLRQELEIGQIHTLIGGSMGGQQALEWSIMQPDVVRNLIQIASNAQHSPWGIAFNESQRMAIESDASWLENRPDAGLDGMRTARSIALLSYRHYRTYQKTQQDATSDQLTNYRASSYQRYQGEKLARRFNAFSYWVLSRAMDSHHVGRGRDSVISALKRVKARTLQVGIGTDVLFPPNEQQFLAQHIAGSQLAVIYSDYGHDGFLLEYSQLRYHITSFYQEENTSTKVSEAN
ncbi:homoserine O-acetyltransferase family protein [Tunicatimonas pelagia]|uniref:homoserine O-acetyltransferase family protein n=1 Tax=Tunicatimonas pelagia TaxID=931531 RepID=UPI002665FDEB|nr:homoserine O-acetyltransferase [Tunicatimonas pelagia]WKN42719.1 homoserine O-acetyltransferase [Tunicatimonas pelagia]